MAIAFLGTESEFSGRLPENAVAISPFSFSRVAFYYYLCLVTKEKLQIYESLFSNWGCRFYRS